MFDNFMPDKSTLEKLMMIKAILDKRRRAGRRQDKKNEVAKEPERRQTNE